MNQVLIVDASSSDPRIMAGLLTKAGYDPITAQDFDAAKEAVAKLPPGAVVVAAMKFTGGTAREFINWQKREGYKFPVIAIVENLNALTLSRSCRITALSPSCNAAPLTTVGGSRR